MFLPYEMALGHTSLGQTFKAQKYNFMIRVTKISYMSQLVIALCAVFFKSLDTTC